MPMTFLCSLSTPRSSVGHTKMHLFPPSLANTSNDNNVRQRHMYSLYTLGRTQRGSRISAGEGYYDYQRERERESPFATSSLYLSLPQVPVSVCVCLQSRQKEIAKSKLGKKRKLSLFFTKMSFFVCSRRQFHFLLSGVCGYYYQLLPTTYTKFLFFQEEV